MLSTCASLHTDIIWWDAVQSRTSRYPLILLDNLLHMGASPHTYIKENWQVCGFQNWKLALKFTFNTFSIVKTECRQFNRIKYQYLTLFSNYAAHTQARGTKTMGCCEKGREHCVCLRTVQIHCSHTCKNLKDLSLNIFYVVYNFRV